MAAPTNFWCTDEDCAIRAAGDFALLPPKHQCLARGTDGAILFGDLWTLTSATQNFITQGIATGQVVQLVKAGVFLGTELMAVASVLAGSITLRRIGLAAGLGLAPGPAGGTTGVAFTVLTLSPQIIRATYDVNVKIGIDDIVLGRRSIDLVDREELRDCTTLLVLWRAYEQAARSAGESADHFAAQAKNYRNDYDDRQAQTTAHWIQQGTVTGQESGPFGTRIGR